MARAAWVAPSHKSNMRGPLANGLADRPHSIFNYQMIPNAGNNITARAPLMGPIDNVSSAKNSSFC